MSENNDYILLKWGTIKGYDFRNSPKSAEAMRKYQEEGMNVSRMMQKDSPNQKQLICEMIDNVNGEIQNDWSGEIYETKEAAKKYVLEYGEND